LHVAAETVRQHTVTVGAAVAAAQHAAMATLAVPRTAAEVVSADPAPAELTVQTDGVYVRYRDRDRTDPSDRGWREVKVGVVGGWVPPGPRPVRRQAKREVARQQRCHQAGASEAELAALETREAVG